MDDKARAGREEGPITSPVLYGFLAALLLQILVSVLFNSLAVKGRFSTIIQTAQVNNDDRQLRCHSKASRLPFPCQLRVENEVERGVIKIVRRL